jgi:hypothetical protein
MKLTRFLPSLIATAIASGALAQTTATGVITLLSTNGTTNNYDIDLDNTGSTGIQTFWFAWVPGLNFMPDMPTGISQPTGWTETITGNAAGYAIQWKTSGGLASGTSLDGFQFTSIDSLTTLEGNSQGHPILTSFVYSGQPLSGTSDQFVVTPAPEPGSWITLAGLAIVGTAVRRRRVAGARL